LGLEGSLPLAATERALQRPVLPLFAEPLQPLQVQAVAVAVSFPDPFYLGHGFSVCRYSLPASQLVWSPRRRSEGLELRRSRSRALCGAAPAAPGSGRGGGRLLPGPVLPGPWIQCMSLLTAGEPAGRAPAAQQRGRVAAQAPVRRPGRVGRHGERCERQQGCV